MSFSAQTPPADSPSHLQPNRACAHRLSRRTLLKGVGGLAAASVIGGGAVVAAAAPAQAALTVAEHEDHGRMQYYKLATSSVGWLSRVNVLLPDGYDTCAATRALPAARRRRGLLDLRHKIRHPQPHRRARPHCCHARRRGGRLVLRPRVLQRGAAQLGDLSHQGAHPLG